MSIQQTNMIKAALVAASLSLTAGIASAATVTFESLGIAELNALTPVSNPSPSATSPVFFDNVTGDQFDSDVRVARSVWKDTEHEDTGVYSSVQANASATFTFAGEQDRLELIWGSPDDYNDLIITLSGGGGDVVINGADVQGPVGELASFVTITDVLFTSVTFEATENAFEFANLSATPVPLPAGALLIGTALAGFGFMRRRRKA